MIVTVEMPGGSLAQGDMILQIGTYATVNAGGIKFRTPEDAADHHGVSRQTVYNRAASARFPDWEIKTWREVK